MTLPWPSVTLSETLGVIFDQDILFKAHIKSIFRICTISLKLETSLQVMLVQEYQHIFIYSWCIQSNMSSSKYEFNLFH